MAGNADFDELISTTLKDYTPSLADNVFESQPYLYWISEGARARDYSGGTSIVEPLMYGTNDTVATYSGYDPLPTTPQEGISAAEFPLKQGVATVAISGDEEVRNSGSPEKIIDLLEAKMFQARESMVQFFNGQFLTSDGTGNSGKDWHGLAVLIGDEFIEPVVGGIDGSDPLNAFWRSVINDGGNAESIAGSGPAIAARALTLAEMRTMYNDVSNGTDHPDLIIASQTQYEKYEALMTPQQTFTAGTKMADAGFTSLAYKGVPIVFDNQVPEDSMYFLNSKYLKMRPYRGRWFTTTPFVRPYDVDAKFANILLYGQQTVNNRRRQGLLTNLTT